MPEIKKTDNGYELFMVRSSNDIPSPPIPYAKYIVFEEHREVVFDKDGNILHEMWGVPYEPGTNVEFVEDTTNDTTIIKYTGTNTLHIATDEEIQNLEDSGFITPKQMCEFVDNYVENVIKPKIIYEDDKVRSEPVEQQYIDN